MNAVINSRDREPDWKLFGAEIRKIVVGRTPGDSDKQENPLRIQALPGDFATRFENLTHLYLWGIEALEALPPLPPKLKCLDLRGCADLAELPPLPATLETLDLGGCNRLREVKVKNLPLLKWLYLDQCSGLQSLVDFKQWLTGLKRLELNGCRFDDLPESLCGEAKENVLAKVQNHFAAIETQGAAVLPECKIVVLGNGGVGKTSVVRALKDLPHIENHDSTEGIRLWAWDGGGFVPFPQANPEKVRLNVWDFGGQDLYHNTHRLFLESRAVFVVVWRQPRRDGKPFRTEKQYEHDPVRPLDYWLDQVFAANPRAQVLIVRTGMDEDAQHPPEDWKKKVREEYRGLPAYEVSAKERGLGELSGLRDALRAAVVRELRGPEAMRLGLGRAAVRDELRQWQPPTPDDDLAAADSSRPILRLHEFIELVKAIYHRERLPEPSEAEPLMLLDYLHHCGALYCPPSWRSNVHFQAALPIIVDQRWATEAIYELFRPGDVREALIHDRGVVTSESLGTEVWDNILRDGQPRYDATAQWIFTRFMLSCGILVSLGQADDPPAGGEMVLPEFLPKHETWVKFNKADPLIAATVAEDEPRQYIIRDRSLGQGFGCLLVGLLPRLFGKVPLFRYGGAGRIRVGGHQFRPEQSQDHFEVVVQMEWRKERDDAYQGDLILRIFGDERADAQVLHFLTGELHGLPGFPKEASFQILEGPLPETLQRQLGFLRLPPRSEFGLPEKVEQTRAIQRLGTVGLSLAGEDGLKPGIELFPQAVERALNAISNRAFDVLCYRSDEQRKLVSELVSDLARSDLMLAFISPKYLRSEYCMAEFLKTARVLQPNETFEKPLVWPHSLWLLLLPEALDLLGQTDGAGALTTELPCQEWKRQWVNRAAEYQSMIIKTFRGWNNAQVSAPSEFVYHEWMQFASAGEEGLGLILAAIAQVRDPVRLPSPPAGIPDLEAWALHQMKALAQKIADKLNALVSQLSPAAREEKIRALCLRLWRADKRAAAAEAFEYWLKEHPDPINARQDAMNDKKGLRVSELEPVRVYWRESQGVK